MDNKNLATNIARELFKLGGEPGSPTTRIAFKGRDRNGLETPQGGLSESSLNDFLFEQLEIARIVNENPSFARGIVLKLRKDLGI